MKAIALTRGSPVFGLKNGMGGGKALQTLRLIRLALSGGIAGVALVGIFFPHVSSFHLDAIGAGAGFTTVILVKLTHLV